MREIIILDYDEIHSAWDMYKAFKENYGIFLDKKEGVAFFNTESIHKFAENIDSDAYLICRLLKLDRFAYGCDKIKEEELINNKRTF